MRQQVHRTNPGCGPTTVIRIFVLASGIALSSCASTVRRPAVPEALADHSVIPGMVAVRTWSDELNDEFKAEILTAAKREIEVRKAEGNVGSLPRADFLAISGGGANGAFGAGLLCGWTAAGTRPEFKVVTGISTGALSAPFVFLGSAYDESLKEVYTRTRTRDLIKSRGMLAGLFSDALMDSRPMWQMSRKYFNEEMLSAIAREYARGRILLIGTTNLDSQRGVIWNIGAIAASGDPRALELFRSILIASAAIPAAFPPVMIDVEAGGKSYQEMHVDGGAMVQVFLYPPSFSVNSGEIQRDRRVYIIRNARLDPNWADVQRRTLKIAARAIDSLIQMQGIGDLYRMYLTSLRDKVDFNLAFIPPEFSLKPKEGFDPVYMGQLFDLAYRMASEGYPWSKTPPGYVLGNTTGSEQN